MSAPAAPAQELEPGVSVWPDEDEVCARFAPRVRAIALRHLRDRSLADDVVQEVLASVVVALRERRVGAPEALPGYVLSAARRRISDVARTDYRRASICSELADIEASVKTRVVGPDERYLDMEHFVIALAPLSGRERQIVNETLTCGRTAEELAALVGTTPENVRVLRHRALSKMRAALGWQEGA